MTTLLCLFSAMYTLHRKDPIILEKLLLENERGEASGLRSCCCRSDGFLQVPTILESSTVSAQNIRFGPHGLFPFWYLLQVRIFDALLVSSHASVFISRILCALIRCSNLFCPHIAIGICFRFGLCSGKESRPRPADFSTCRCLGLIPLVIRHNRLGINHFESLGFFCRHCSVWQFDGESRRG